MFCDRSAFHVPLAGCDKIAMAGCKNMKTMRAAQTEQADADQAKGND
jgi:protein gp37